MAEAPLDAVKKPINKVIKKENDKPFTETIGIIICKKDNHFVMEYCSDDRIYRTTYVLN